MADGKIELVVYEADDKEGDDDVAYLTLPDHPGRATRGCVAKQTRLYDVIQYNGPDILLDFDKNGRLIGVEVLM